MSKEPIVSIQTWTASVQDVSRWLAFGSFAIAVTGFLGRLTGIGQLASTVAGWEPMTMVSALGQALVAASLASRWLGPRCRMMMLTISCVLATAVLLSHLATGMDLVSPALGGFIADLGRPPAQMSSGSAISLLLIAAVIWPAPGWPQAWLRDAAAATVFLVAMMVLVGYAYGPQNLGDLLPFRLMSVNSGASLLLLSMSTILSHPESGWAQVIASPDVSGAVTRRQMLYTLVPTALGFALVRANQSGVLPVAAAMALLVVFTVIPLLWLVLRDGRTLIALDEERAERLHLEQSYAADLKRQLEEQAAELAASNAKLLAHARAASMHHEVRYRQLFDSIDAGFCIIEMKFDAAGAPVDYRFVEVNAAFERQTGMIDAAGRWVRDIVPEHEQHWFDLYGKVARTGTSVRIESPARGMEGRWFDVYAFRTGDAADHLVGILFNDVSSRRAIELQLKAMNETLEQRVEAAIGQREEAQEALRQSQKMEAIGQLTGGVAHDFNNLLTPILGGLDLLSRRDLGEREQRLIVGALQSAERAKTLVQRLLAFARRQPLQPGPIDIGALVAGMSDLVASTSGPQIRVVVDIAPDLPPAIGDANQLEMAVLNLCVNARDAMPTGGRLSVSVSRSQRPPGHPDLPAGPYIRLSVADDGIGMDSDTAGRAIEPFFSTKGIGKGTGLGLSMVHGLALQLGGALTIYSKVGLGTRIDLFLRVGDAAAASAPAMLDQAPTPATGRILVVDDQEQVRTMTSDLLQELGFTTEECESGSLAEMRMARGDHFDLVVTDYLMPGLSGADLAGRLAQTRPEVGVLIVSGYIDGDAIAPGLQFLRKPFRKDELAAAVDGALRAAHVGSGQSA